MRCLVPILLLSILGASCQNDQPPGSPAESVASAPIPYRLDTPAAAFSLPGSLREISGLTALDDQHLGAVEDERGVLYVLARETAQLTESHVFRGRGDYEGVERVGARIWALKSNGTLYAFSLTSTSDPAVFDTGLHGSCDAEGLTHDAARARLLIACKEHPGRNLTGMRAIYAFDLATHTLEETPAFTLDRRTLDTERRAFKPSALAVHPQTGDVYVLSSARKALAVLSPDGHLTAAYTLPATLYPQPEGLAFFSDGTLYIANEGPHGPATLLRFDEQPLP